MTRISDYYHHPLDVATGSFVGISFAVSTFYVLDLGKKEFVFWSLDETKLPKNEESESLKKINCVKPGLTRNTMR